MAPLFETLFTSTRLPLSPHSPTKDNACNVVSVSMKRQHHDSPSLSMTPRTNNGNSKPNSIHRFNFNTTPTRKAEVERDEKLTSISRHLRELSKDAFMNDDISNAITTPTSPRTGSSPRRNKNPSSSTTSPMPYIEIHNSNSNSSSQRNALMEGMNQLHHLMILEMQKHNSIPEAEKPNHQKSSQRSKESIQQRLDVLLQKHPTLSHPSIYSDDKNFNFSSFYRTCAALLSTVQTLSNQNYMLNQQYLKVQEKRRGSNICHSTEIGRLISKNYQLQQENVLLHDKVESYRQQRMNDQLRHENEMRDLRIQMRRLYEERMYALMLFHEGVLQGEMIQRSKEQEKHSDGNKEIHETHTSLPESGMSSLLWLIENEDMNEEERDDNDDYCPTTARKKNECSIDTSLASVPPKKPSSHLIKTSDATVAFSFGHINSSATHHKPQKGALQLADAMIYDDKHLIDRHNRNTSNGKIQNDKDIPTNVEMKTTEDDKEKEVVIIVPKTKTSGVKLLCVPGIDSHTNQSENGKTILVYAISDNFDKSLNEASPPIGSKLISLNSSPIETLDVQSVKELKRKIDLLQNEGNDVTLTFRRIDVEKELNNKQKIILDNACKKFESKQRKREEEKQEQKQNNMVAAFSPFKKKSSKTLKQTISDDEKEERYDVSESQQKQNNPSSWLASSKHSNWLTNSSSRSLLRSSSAASLTKIPPRTLVCDDDRSCTSSLSSSSSLKSLYKGSTTTIKAGTVVSNLPPCEIEEGEVLFSEHT